jgi:uncharacterized membrane protein SpoIIM required for sporulation
MILDLPRFVDAERPYWDELGTLLARIENEPGRSMTLDEIKRLHYLYERCSADLSRLDTFSAEHSVRGALEALVSHAYAEIHETRAPLKLRWRALAVALPRAFRLHLAAFALSLGVTLLGSAFGVYALRADPHTKAIILPFSHLSGAPGERVHEEETAKRDRLHDRKTSFSASLMTHNTQVTVFTAALGLTWGVGTVLVLFYNGVILGAVAADYIPSILLGGQAGFMLASAMIGWRGRSSRAARLRAVAPDLFAILAGAACLLIWAGLIEAFVSQYHQPVIPYAAKIAFGCCEFAALLFYLGWAGRE